MRNLFAQIASRSAYAMGHYWAFIIATFACIVWAVSGPLFGFSDTWQLVINTATTVLTFLMVFLIQNTQNRDSMALQLKLDELIKAVQGTNEQLIDIEESSEDEIESFKDDYRKLAHDRHSNIPRPVEATGGKGNAAV